MESLAQQRCVPCEGGITHPLTRNDLEFLLPQIPPGWRLAPDARSLERELTFSNFRQAMAFLNRLAELAETEGHHPDFRLHGWKHVTVSLTTYALHGLTRNDLILAAKMEPLIGLS
ncbi:MAG TPA: 4a-hydroxytetrahydrobiopterin dehydratase [Chloroflexota bacterium]